MKSLVPGKNISKAEILDITSRGIWILAGREELFLTFKSFPWFQNATVGQIQHVEFNCGKYLHWPDLDVDVEIDSIKAPDRYPLVYR